LKKTAELIEKLSEQVHNSWWEEKKKQGFSDPIKTCPKCGVGNITPIEHDHQRCVMCGYEQKTDSSMVPYDELPESVKIVNRATVSTVLQALDSLGYKISKAKGGDDSA
jgi:ribosomal protein S27AE